MRVFVALRLLGCNTSNNSTYFLYLGLDVTKNGEAASEQLEEIFYILLGAK